ncbi:hypothetical protein BOSEA31B_20793 [Hyphomicrobiales bacterium]|nr:hypothetical protein BOSEA31B_20793 [Hyphomicrobiales bacterium]CAH1702711.1 hypothetical protein BOSEA1005_30583 [Hyphomicrobiales bacterium]CAI0346900.1 hypothetical protein BO1005MUT1_530076 [Hyphomicrobiales bacterium]
MKDSIDKGEAIQRFLNPPEMVILAVVQNLVDVKGHRLENDLWGALSIGDIPEKSQTIGVSDLEPAQVMLVRVTAVQSCDGQAIPSPHRD